MIEGWRAAWRPKFQAVRAKQEALAAELAALYPDVANKLKELFGRLEEADREAREIDRSKPLDRRGIPTGDGRHFRPTAELAGATPAFLKELRLPALDNPQDVWWPGRAADVAQRRELISTLSSVPYFANPNSPEERARIQPSRRPRAARCRSTSTIGAAPMPSRAPARRPSIRPRSRGSGLSSSGHRGGLFELCRGTPE